MLAAVGDVTTYCSCGASYSERRQQHVVVTDDPTCPIHHPPNK
ncbi:hypothetical protein ACIRG5_42265 [Lentzea sp. NPDC102401]